MVILLNRIIFFTEKEITLFTVNAYNKNYRAEGNFSQMADKLVAEIEKEDKRLRIKKVMYKILSSRDENF